MVRCKWSRPTALDIKGSPLRKAGHAGRVPRKSILVPGPQGVKARMQCPISTVIVTEMVYYIALQAMHAEDSQPIIYIFFS